LTNPKILVCPGQASVTTLNSQERASFYFNPHAARFKNGGATYITTRYKKLNDYRDTKRSPKPGAVPIPTVARALACDFFYDVGSMSHNFDRKRQMGLNLVFADGHVASLYSRAAYGRLQAAGSTNWSWVRTNDVIGMFEYQAAGKPQDLPAGGPNWTNSCSEYDPHEPFVKQW
jgi:prepilin-type processing-associated H-X9-DG protein